MSVRTVAALLLAFGCGRVNFDPQDTVARCDYRAHAVGRNHTCAIDGAGQVWCWGNNTSGEAVPGGAPTLVVPAAVTLPAAAVQVATGRALTCARLQDGSVWCWGTNTEGQLGTTVFTQGPNEVPLNGDRAIDLAVGARHACIRRESDSAILCWGDNRFGQLGVTSPINTAVPQLLIATDGTQQLALGHNHSCALDRTGAPVCWGGNRRGELGDGAFIDHAARSVVVGLNPVSRIVAGGCTTCALEMSGDLRCWGCAGGHGLPGTANLPMPGPAVLKSVADVGVGATGGCARSDATLTCWGEVDDGLLYTTPEPRTTPIPSAFDVAINYQHSCATIDGTLQCWGGQNLEGELGRGTRGFTPTPTRVPLTDVAIEVSVGWYHACARTPAALWCWGANAGGEIGDGTTTVALMPVKIDTGLTTIDGLDLSHRHTCAWGGGVGRCWGRNESGELGTGTTSSAEVRPVAFGALAAVTHMSSGAAFTCAIDGARVVCAGGNANGELGDGTNNARTSPTIAVLNITNPTVISSGNNHACAIAAGQLSCWGHGIYGQLGDGLTASTSTPVAALNVPGAGAVTSVKAGGYHTCAIRGGVVSCWGRNDAGQLGDGSLTTRLVPTRVSLPSAAVAIAVTRRSPGFGGTCAILDTGAVYCWGAGDHGELANGELANATTPFEIPALRDATSISRASYVGCAVVGGEARCWGTPPVLANGDASSYLPAPVTCSR